MIKNILILTVLLTFCACNKSKSVAQEEIGQGTLENGLYTNPYFNISIQLPMDWALQTAAEEKEIMDAGSELIAGDDKTKQAQIELAKKKTLQLFTLMRYPQGATVDFNYSFIGVAERVKNQPGIKKGSDYLFHVKKVLKSSSLDYKFPKEVFSETISGLKFDVLPGELHINGMTIHQHYYACKVKDYVLSFILSFNKEEEHAHLLEVLKKLKVK